jgi:hypothetical protein
LKCFFDVARNRTAMTKAPGGVTKDEQGIRIHRFEGHACVRLCAFGPVAFGEAAAGE